MPLFPLLAVAIAEDMSWQCEDAATLPEDVVAWKDATAWEPVEDAIAEAFAWYDAACVTCVTDDDGAAETCEAVACVTGAGATIDYLYVHASDPWAGETTTTTSLTVTPPSGTWTRLSVETVDHSWSTSSSSSGNAEAAVVAWVGVLRPDWPVDGGFAAETSSAQTGYGGRRSRSWDDGACAWGWSRETDTDNAVDTVRMQGRTFDVYEVEWARCGVYRAAAYVDDVYVGLPDPDDWTLLETDDDGDGWAEPDDCDDADAAVNPCGTDALYVDGDCDGAADYDADGDGWDAEAYGGRDCDDTTASIHPGLPETWYDGVDTNCDGLSDYDADEDGHDADAYGGDDCDDADDGVSPSAPEVECDGVDQDCDGADACADTGAGPSADAPPPVSDEAPRRGCGEGMGALVLLPLLRRRRAQTGRTVAP